MEPPVENEGHIGQTAASQDVVSDAEAAAAAFEEPIHLLRPSKDHGALIADAGALERLSSLGLVTVLAVVGNQRGGKSTLMNLLHGRKLSGFQTGHYLDPQTHGVWVWPKPHPRRPGVTILLVDTEGLDSPHIPQHYGWLVAAVTALMSDVFMYQTRASIEQSAAERLEMILKVVEQLRGGGEGAACKAGIFFWLLRDHQLQLKCSPKEELGRLAPEQVKAVQRSFAEYDCIPLPRPAADDVLASLDQRSFQELKAEFQEEFLVLERRLLDSLAEPRPLCGEPLTGVALAELLRDYLAAVAERRGMIADICEMPTHRDLLRQLAGRRAVEAGVRRYKAALREAGVIGADARLPLPPGALLESHAGARRAAAAAYEEEAARSGLELAEQAESLAQLEEQLAAWATRPRVLAQQGLGEVAASDDLTGADAPSDGAPLLAEVRTLHGGLFLELWRENARRASGACERWLQSLTALRDEAVRAQREAPAAVVSDMDPPALEALRAYHDGARGAVDQAQGDGGGLGPWSPLVLGGRGEETAAGLGGAALALSQHGDEVVLAIAEGLVRRAEAQAERRLEASERRWGEASASLAARVDAEVSTRLSSLETQLEARLQELHGGLDALAAECDEHRAAARELAFAAEVRSEARGGELRSDLERLVEARSEAVLAELRPRLGDAGAVVAACQEELAALSAAQHAAAATTGERIDALEAACRAAMGEELARCEASAGAAAEALERRVSDSVADIYRRLAESGERVDRGVREATSALVAAERNERGHEALEAALLRLEGDVREAEVRARETVDRAIRESLESTNQRMQADIAEMKDRAASTSEDLQRATELMKRHDLDTIWESIAQLAARLAELQCDMDGISSGFRNVAGR